MCERILETQITDDISDNSWHPWLHCIESWTAPNNLKWIVWNEQTFILSLFQKQYLNSISNASKRGVFRRSVKWSYQFKAWFYSRLVSSTKPWSTRTDCPAPAPKTLVTTVVRAVLVATVARVVLVVLTEAALDQEHHNHLMEPLQKRITSSKQYTAPWFIILLIQKVTTPYKWRVEMIPIYIWFSNKNTRQMTN